MARFFQGIINRPASQQERTGTFDSKADLLSYIDKKGLEENTKITVLEVNQKVVDHFSVKVTRKLEREQKQA